MAKKVVKHTTKKKVIKKATVIKKKPITAKKPVKKESPVKLDVNLINKEFEKFCKKFKLDRAVLLIAQLTKKKDVYHDMVCANIKNHIVNEEEELANGYINFLRHVSLNTNAINNVNSIVKDFLEKLKSEQEKEKLLDAFIEEQEAKLSEEDKKKLQELRILKNKYVNEQKYDKAVDVREEEMKLLGIDINIQPDLTKSIEKICENIQNGQNLTN